MLKKNQVFGVLLSFLFFSASCRTPDYKPTEEEKRNADYGVKPDNYKEIIKEYFQARLKDPDSGKYRFDGEPEKTFFSGKSLGELKFCWKVVVWINAKNSFGGYTGEQYHMVWIRDGKVIMDFP